MEATEQKQEEEKQKEVVGDDDDDEFEDALDGGADDFQEARDEHDQ